MISAAITSLEHCLCRREIDQDICRYAVESILHASRGGVVPTCAVFPVTLVTRETT